MIEDALLFIVSWIAQPSCCRKCLALDGYTWEVPNNIEEVTRQKEMMSHPNCKCTVDVEVEVDLERLQVWSQ
jgi:hypothetical protein